MPRADSNPAAQTPPQASASHAQKHPPPRGSSKDAATPKKVGSKDSGRGLPGNGDRELPNLPDNNDHELKEALEEITELRKLLRKNASELNRQHNERTNIVDDKYIIERWRGLIYNIKDWAARHFDGKPKFSLAKWLKSTEKVHRLVGDPVRYLNDPSLKLLLIQAYVWSRLAEDVFNCTGPDTALYWAGRSHTTLRALRKLLDPGTSCPLCKLKIVLIDDQACK
jgi:hypothetical protein